MFKYDVTIIGGGLAGLTAACLLVREGKRSLFWKNRIVSVAGR